jgi:hypothetical protein
MWDGIVVYSTSNGGRGQLFINCGRWEDAVVYKWCDLGEGLMCTYCTQMLSGVGVWSCTNGRRR